MSALDPGPRPGGCRVATPLGDLGGARPSQAPPSTRPTSPGPTRCSTRRRARWYDTRADLWEATVGRTADRVVDSHVRAASEHAGAGLHVVDLGAGSARSLDRLARLGVPVSSYLGIERDTSMVAASVGRTARRPEATVIHGRIEHLPPEPSAGPRLVLLTWVLSTVTRPGEMLDLARRTAGRGGVVVAAAVTAVSDRPTPLDSWIRHRWRVRPVDPTLLAAGADRLSVTLRGRAVVATIGGRDGPEHSW